jgi:hypothetical protein
MEEVMLLVSQREYARRKGCSAQYINKLVKEGKIPNEGGKIDPELADAALAQSRLLRMPSPAGAQRVSYAQARTVSETYKAKRAKLLYEKLSGSLVSLADVKRAQKQSNAIIRAKLLSIPTKLAPRLAGKHSAVELKAILQTEIYEVLRELAATAGNVE